MSHDVCLSGGARGADLAWGDAAMDHGHDVVHFGFARHKSSAPANTIQTLSDAELAVANPYLAIANKTMNRRWPISNQFVANLLRRNYYQVVETEAVYAVSTFEKGMVAGGTCWAVQMYLDRFDHGYELPCYVYDQIRKTWTQWDGGGFLEIDAPPRPCGVWTGIGTRELNRAGMEAIQKVW